MALLFKYLQNLLSQTEVKLPIYTFNDYLIFLVIPILFLFLISVLFTLLIERNLLDNEALQKTKFEEEIIDFLMGLIFLDSKNSIIKEKIVQFRKTNVYKKKWCEQFVLNQLIHIKENIKDLNSELIIFIYKEFDLHLYSEKLIKQSKWHSKSLGFYHYKALDYKSKIATIKPFLNSKNKYLKSNALITIISLSNEKFDVLNNYPDKISAADEIKILDLIYEKESVIPTTVFDWLHNKNNSIVILAIKLIIRYRVSISLLQIQDLLNNDDAIIRNTVIVAIKELFIVEANDMLVRQYYTETNIQNKIGILKTLGINGDEKTLNFVSKLIKIEKKLDVKFEIISCINKIDFSYFDNYTFKDHNETKMLNKIILHVKNPYLN